MQHSLLLADKYKGIDKKDANLRSVTAEDLAAAMGIQVCLPEVFLIPSTTAHLFTARCWTSCVATLGRTRDLANHPLSRSI